MPKLKERNKEKVFIKSSTLKSPPSMMLVEEKVKRLTQPKPKTYSLIYKMNPISQVLLKLF